MLTDFKFSLSGYRL